MKKKNVFRLGLVLFGFLIFYLVIMTKLFYWMVVRSADLSAAERAQSSEAISEPATRGDILTADNFPLVTNKFSYLLYANPKLISSNDRDKDSQLLSPILQTDAATISAELSKNLFWVRLAQGLDDEDKLKVENLHLDGLGFQQNSVRFYPEASMAANLVGFLGKDQNGNDHGYFGLEGYYNNQLNGRDGKLYVVKDALGNPILNDIREEKKIDGRSLVLNINRTIQYDAEKRLLDGIQKYEADGGAVVIMDPNTGKVLAMASFPSYDPKTYYEFPATSYDNAGISELYEPGSTFKVLVMAAAINEKKITPDTECDICSGPVPIDGYEIHTWDDKYFPNTTMTDVLQHSDNTGMTFVGRKLGKNLFLKYIHNFGFGEPTGIDLQGEESGEIRADDQWHNIDLATATFGQGITVTPIQLLTGVNTIANGGFLMKPEVVSKVITADGKQIPIQPVKERQVISDATSKVMTWMMVNAADNGESKFARIPNYEIAGKTGTAQIPLAGHYDPTHTNASFVGFFPAEHPTISMLVILNSPKASIYGAETAAPIFFQIAGDLIHYYNIPPSD